MLTNMKILDQEKILQEKTFVSKYPLAIISIPSFFFYQGCFNVF